MKIKLKRDIWLVKSEGGGLDGHYNHVAILVSGDEWFEVVGINEVFKRHSNIHVWSDGACDGQNIFLLNVPNECIITEVKHDNSTPLV